MSDTGDTVDHTHASGTPDSVAQSPQGPTPSPVAGVPGLTGSTPADLEREVCQVYQQVDLFRLVPMGGPGDTAQTYLGIGRLGQQIDPSAADDLSAELAGALAARGLTVMPFFLPAGIWGELGAQTPRDAWVGCLRPSDGVQEQLRLVAKRQPQPRELREWLLRLVGERADLIGSFRQAVDLPVHITLQLCAAAAHEALQLSFAMGDEVFETDARAIPTARRCVDRMPLGPADVQEYFALLGQLEHARLVRRFVGSSQRHTPDPANALAWTEGLLRRLGKHVRTHLVTDEERQTARRRRIGFGIAAAVAVVAAVVGYLVATAPRAPLSDLSRITKPGGISASYFRGTNFNKLVFRRSDPRVHIHATGSPDSRLPRDGFSAMWQGFLRFHREGSHALCVESDDGARLYFDGRQIAGDWSSHGRERSCARVRVKPGWYPIKVEYFEAKGRSILRLLVGPDEAHVRPVASKNLCCRVTP